MTREFPLGVVLTMVTGRLLCDFDDLHGALTFMVGEDVFTHQLPRVADECTAPILARYPELAEIVVPEDLDGAEAVYAWLAGIVDRYGPSRELEPLAPEDHTSIDPFTELATKMPGKPVVAVVLDDE